MTFPERLASLMPLIYPKFHTVTDSFGHEFVLLCRESDVPIPAHFSVLDRTEFEATRNLVRVFERMTEKDCPQALLTGEMLAKNLLKELKNSYPDKAFRVTLEINPKAATCIRFHQIWPGEEPFVSPDEKQKSTEVLVFKA